MWKLDDNALLFLMAFVGGLVISTEAGGKSGADHSKDDCQLYPLSSTCSKLIANAAESVGLEMVANLAPAATADLDSWMNTRMMDTGTKVAKKINDFPAHFHVKKLAIYAPRFDQDPPSLQLWLNHVNYMLPLLSLSVFEITYMKSSMESDGTVSQSNETYSTRDCFLTVSPDCKVSYHNGGSLGISCTREAVGSCQVSLGGELPKPSVSRSKNAPKPKKTDAEFMQNRFQDEMQFSKVATELVCPAAVRIVSETLERRASVLFQAFFPAAV